MGGYHAVRLSTLPYHLCTQYPYCQTGMKYTHFAHFLHTKLNVLPLCRFLPKTLLFSILFSKGRVYPKSRVKWSSYVGRTVHFRDIFLQVILANTGRNQLQAPQSTSRFERHSIKGSTRLTIKLLVISFAFLFTMLPFTIFSIVGKGSCRPIEIFYLNVSFILITLYRSR